ncbi:hypothetical protein B5E53_17555 [Eubacterium sp. An11]|nr:hypothetical protein B5E53_17555 [Eubacterium sp. An11]
MSAFIIPFFEFLQKQYERINIKGFNNEIFYCYYVLYHILRKKEEMFCFALSLNLKTKGDPCQVFSAPTRWPESTFYLFLSFLLFLYFYYNTINRKSQAKFKKSNPLHKVQHNLQHLSLLSQNNKALTNTVNKYNIIFLTRNSLIFPRNKIQMIKIEKK